MMLTRSESGESIGETTCSYSTITPRTVSLQNRHRRLASSISLHLELVMRAHHAQEPLVGFTGRVKAVEGRQAERHLSGLEERVWVFAADGEAEGVISLAS